MWNGDTFEMVQVDDKVCLITSLDSIFIRDALRPVPSIRIEVALQLESQSHQEIEDSSAILIEEIQDFPEVEDIQLKYEFIQQASNYDQSLALIRI